MGWCRVECPAVVALLSFYFGLPEIWVEGLARIPSHHRATTVPVRRKPQMTAEHGRKIQRQPSSAKAFRRTISRIVKRIIIVFEGSYV